MDALNDNRLSLRARGLYMLYKSIGEVISSTETQKLVPEGRDAIRKAMSELKAFGYIEEVRYQTGYGHWNVLFRFPVDGKPGDGFSGDLSRCTDYIANSDITLALFSNENKSSVSGTPKEEEEVMGWKDWEDEPTGSVGKLPPDKKVLRQEKYTKSKIASTKASTLRHERPEESWTTDDLLAEFYSLTRQHGAGAPSQVNGRNLASWINKHVGEGVPRKAILDAMRMFFDDPRLIRDPGVGQPFWRRFVAFYPTVHGIVTRIDNSTDDDDTSAHQAKMLKLLEN